MQKHIAYTEISKENKQKHMYDCIHENDKFAEGLAAFDVCTAK